MKKNMLIYTLDILASIELIEKYIAGLTFKKFESTDLILDAVNRRLTIIGEAAARLTPEFKKTHQDVPWKQIIGLRNIIIHNYEEVMLKVIWKIVTKDLPKTKMKLLKISKTLKQ